MLTAFTFFKTTHPNDIIITLVILRYTNLFREFEVSLHWYTFCRKFYFNQKSMFIQQII